MCAVLVYDAESLCWQVLARHRQPAPAWDEYRTARYSRQWMYTAIVLDHRADGFELIETEHPDPERLMFSTEFQAAIGQPPAL